LPEATGTLATALAHTARLLDRDAALAAEQAGEILKVVPRQPEALRLLAAARAALGDWPRAEAATAQLLEVAARDPALLAAARALGDNRLAVAETLLRKRLDAAPSDVAALRMLAEVAGRLGRYGDAERLLVHAVALAPAFSAARANLAQVYHRRGKPAEALAELERLARRAPGDPGHRTLRAAVLARIGDTQGSLALYAAVLAEHPQQPKGWMSYGHALKTVGRVADSIAAYRTAIAQAPGLGEAWWSLANLKTLRFTADDIAAIRAPLVDPALAAEDRYHLHFALGKALEDSGDYDASFGEYALGNALRRAEMRFDADEVSTHRARSVALFTAGFFAARAEGGCPAPDPIFIVGLPRSGSTLIEQILSSHSAVEGTSELSDILSIAGRIGGRARPSAYPDALAALGPGERAALGEEYLARAAINRRTDRPYFIDKMPNNFQHIGLIQLILPNAKIIDARRHPLGCGFSGFKQHFARGQGFTYDLTDLGRYYRDYVALMAHFDAVLPGRIHRVVYEQLVADPEAEIRRLLAYCALPFEAGCLSFHANARAVRTPSAEQVRQPVYTAGVDHWQHYARHLGPLKAALGSVLDSYPAVPPDMTLG